MSDKEKKQLMIAVPLLAVALVLVFLFIIRPNLGGGGGTPAPTPQAGNTSPPAGMAPATPGTGPTGTEGGEINVAQAREEQGPSEEPARGDPFEPYVTVQKIKIPTPPGGFAFKPRQYIPPVGASVGPTITAVEETEEEHERRMAGMLHNGRVWAIYEKDGVSQVVKPGDPVGDETVVAIGPDYLVLQSIDGRRREVPLEQLSGYEGAGSTYRTGTYPMPGTGRPPATPPRPPVL